MSRPRCRPIATLTAKFAQPLPIAGRMLRSGRRRAEGGRTGHRVRHSLGGGVFVIAVSDVWESSGGGNGMKEDESICRPNRVRIRRSDQITPPTN
ncbi:hypothetical protein niasHT_023778 [Heterodera trifolii]|uniref:Uncharacterized protein n=1 Tax=Heterodera trifolii TaxID=157864 RepID=A0ABD2JNM6_9BILA